MKIDMGEVKRNQESLNASIKVMKSQLQSAQASLAKLANNKESLEGTVRTAIDAKIKYHQLPLLMNYESALDIMSKDYDAFITTFQSEVGESDGNAIINTDYLSELSAIFPGITQALSYIQRDTSSTYSDIADIISLTDPSTSEIKTALTEAKQILTDTTNKMSSFNELGTPGTFSEMIGQQNSELATLSSIQGPNYTAPNILSVYQNSDFGLKVKDNMTKDPAQYKVQLQNELAKEIANSKYSGNVAQNQNFNPLENPVIKGGKDVFTTAVIEKVSGKVEDKIIQKGSEKAAQKGAEIFANRYSTTLINGKIMGATPGATKAAMEAAENSITNTAKYIGKGIGQSIGLLAGVGIDLLEGDTVEEAWGKEIITGTAGGLTIGALSLAGVSTPIGWGIAIGVGLNYTNEWLRAKFPEVKNFEDNIGRAVVSGWNNLVNGIKGLFSW
jgi:hypothetical protein